MSAASPLYLGVDVGGQSIKVGLVDSEGTPRAQARVPTEQHRGREVGLENIARGVDLALAGAGLTLGDVAGVGLATPGPMDLPSGTLLDLSNLPGWRDWPIRAAVAERLGVRTVLQNDANAAAYGEYWAGTGRDVDSLVFWTLGTGIGCGMIWRDVILEGAHSHGSECGHIIIDMAEDAREHPGTGQRGTLEAYAGARAVTARAAEALAAGEPSLLNDRVADGAALSPKLICEAAGEGDALAERIMLETATCLGVGTVTVLHTLDPELVLIGGNMTFGGPGTATGRRFLDRIHAEVRARAFPTVAEHVRIDYATLGGDAGFIGAAGCAKRELG